MGRPGTGSPDSGQAGFGSAVRAGRIAARLSQEELSRLSGVGLRTIRDLERGRVRRPHPPTVRDLAAALGLVERDWGRGPERDGEPGGCPPPADVPGFVGRGAELARLARLVPRPGAGPVVVVVTGQAGVGKSGLAARACHVLADRFAEAPRHVDLGGVEDVGAAQAALLVSLGVPADEVPAGVEERRGRYRAATAGRAGLLVLDGAVGEAQVRPLLPGDGPWLVLVTSRGPLAGLDCAARLPLAPLPAAEAAGLLGGVPGAEELVRACGGLPLPLRAAARLLAERPGVSAAELAARVRAGPGWLDLLPDDWRDPFTAAYDRLPPVQRRVFRGLALAPPGDAVTPALTATLAGVAEGPAEDAMEALVDAGLLAPSPRPGRYALHRVARIFAAERHAAEGAHAGRGPGVG